MSLREYLPQSKYLDSDVSLSTHITKEQEFEGTICLVLRCSSTKVLQVFISIGLRE